MRKLKVKQVIISLAVVILLVFFHYINLLRPVENGLILVSRPLAGWFYKIGETIRGTYDRQIEKQDLSKMIEELKVENQELVRENANLKKTEEENEKLRQILKFFDEYKYSHVLANVISKSADIDSPEGQRQLIIDKGSRAGIKPGMAVVSDRGVVVGKISETDDYLSAIVLTTSKECKLAASLQNQTKTSGITEGDLGLTIKMNFIPQTEMVNINDNVVTSGLEESIPRGLIIGRVSRLEKDSNQVWQSATIEPSVDFNNLIVVSVLVP